MIYVLVHNGTVTAHNSYIGASRWVIRAHARRANERVQVLTMEAPKDTSEVDLVVDQSGYPVGMARPGVELPEGHRIKTVHVGTSPR